MKGKKYGASVRKEQWKKTTSRARKARSCRIKDRRWMLCCFRGRAGLTCYRIQRRSGRHMNWVIWGLISKQQRGGKKKKKKGINWSRRFVATNSTTGIISLFSSSFIFYPFVVCGVNKEKTIYLYICVYYIYIMFGSLLLSPASLTKRAQVSSCVDRHNVMFL